MPNSSNYIIEIYSEEHYTTWEDFLSESINGTFLHSRNFLSYHGERFVDASLLIKDQSGTYVALLPMVIQEDIAISHPGITYGGLLHKGINAVEAIQIFVSICGHLHNRGVNRLVYKSIPDIYHSDRANEDLYAIWYLGGELVERSASSVLSSRKSRKRSGRRIRALKNAIKNNVVVKPDADFDAFWRILEENLSAKFHKQPVHTLAEILELRNRFPENIKLLTSRIDNKVVAGVLVFETQTVLHLQYIASNLNGNKSNALDALINQLIDTLDEKILDFGISTENGGKEINIGLHQFKSEFGTGVVNYENYELLTSNVFTRF